MNSAPLSANPGVLLSGWGRAAATASTIVRPRQAADVQVALSDALPRGIVARGLGRGYGDGAQNAGGTVIDMTGLDALLQADLQPEGSGVVRVGAGLSLDALMRLAVPRGWFVPVTPGTRYVTVGGAIAADIHGKNHHVDGSFSGHVLSMTLATPSGSRTVAPDQEPELFWATVGGMGLTGVVVDATLRLPAIETALMKVDTERCSDLDDVMARMERDDHRYRYSVAWVDCLSRSSRTRGSSTGMGRAVLTRGDHARLEDLPAARRPAALDFDPTILVQAPPVFPSGLVNTLSVRLLNEVWYRKAPKQRVGHLEPLSTFFHPLDGVGAWNQLYGSRGFLQYQFAVPSKRSDVVTTAIERLSKAGLGSCLAVLKRFGPAGPAPLSFPIEGWTLALDLPIGRPDLGRLLDDLDEVVAEASGRIYLAKDSRVRPELIPLMYPRLAEWRKVRHRIDPEGVLTSDLARRVQL